MFSFLSESIVSKEVKREAGSYLFANVNAAILYSSQDRSSAFIDASIIFSLYALNFYLEICKKCFIFVPKIRFNLMKRFYKISREGFEIFIMYNEVTEKSLQVTSNSIVVSKGRFVVWEEINPEEFYDAYQKVVTKIQEQI